MKIKSIQTSREKIPLLTPFATALPVLHVSAMGSSAKSALEMAILLLKIKKVV